MEADAGLAEAVHVVPSWAGLDLDGGVPEAAVPAEAGAGLAPHDAVGRARVAAVHPDGSVRAAVVLGDAEGGHGIACHAREAVPLTVDAAVARGLPVRAVDLVLRVPPGLVQADVGRAGVQGWGTHTHTEAGRYQTKSLMDNYKRGGFFPTPDLAELL